MLITKWVDSIFHAVHFPSGYAVKDNMMTFLILFWMMIGFFGCATADGVGNTLNSNPGRKNVHVALMAPKNDDALSSYKRVQPALQLAVRAVEQLRQLDGYNLQVSCICDYTCDEKAVPDLQLFHAHSDNRLDALIGPVDDYLVARAARAMSYWNVPMISPGGSASEFDDNKQYTQLTRIGPVDHVTLGNMIGDVLQMHVWNRIKLIYEQHGQDSVSRNFCMMEMSTLWNILKSQNVQVDVKWVRYHDQHMDDFVQELSSDERNVIAICASSKTVRDLMIMFHEHNLDNGDFIVYNIDLFPDEGQLQRPWYNESDTSERNEKAAQGFQALQTITLRRPTSLTYKRFSMEVKRRAMSMYPNVSFGEGEVNMFVGAYHDAVILYALALNESLQNNITVSDGISITQRMRNRTFQGISGSIKIDENGKRVGDYTLLTMDPVTRIYTAKATYYGRRRQFEPIEGRRIHWAGVRDVPPEPHAFFCDEDVSNCTGSDNISIKIPNTVISEGDGKKAEISCSTVISTGILMIQVLGPSGDPLVYVRDGTRVTLSRKASSNIKAEGSVSTKSKTNNLNVYISSPKTKDSGQYTCIVFYLDPKGGMKNDRSVATLSVKEAHKSTTTKAPKITTAKVPKVTTSKAVNSEFSTESVFNNLMDRLVQVELCGEFQPYWIIGMTDEERRELMKRGPASNSPVGSNNISPDVMALAKRLAKLESMVYANTLYANGTTCKIEYPTPSKTAKEVVVRIKNLENQNAEMEKKLKKLADDKVKVDTSKKDKEVLERLEKLEKEGSKESQQLAALTAKGSFKTAFHSTINKVRIEVLKGMVIAFPNILTLQGQDYDPKTGIFTAPRDGIYGFHLTIDNHGSGLCKIVLKANDRYFSLLTSRNLTSPGQTSVSSVVDLKAGDKVRAIVVDVQGQVYLRGWSYSTFTGYSIWLS